MGQIRWTERASFNLENIHTYIAKDSPFFATKFIEALIDAIKILENTPNCGRVVPELESYEFRELIYEDLAIFILLKILDFLAQNFSDFIFLS